MREANTIFPENYIQELRKNIYLCDVNKALCRGLYKQAVRPLKNNLYDKIKQKSTKAKTYLKRECA